jgi:SNF2 family DNA or RNA helicase
MQAHLTFDRKVQGPHLVVVPLSVLPNWMSEFRKFCPDLRVVRIHVNDEGEQGHMVPYVQACQFWLSTASMHGPDDLM